MNTTERAQVARIRRRLAHQGEDLRKVRADSRWYNTYGPFYVEDLNTRAMVAYGITDLNALEADLNEATP